MRPTHQTPQSALATLGRELESLCADAPRAGAQVERRLDEVLALLPVIGAAARQPGQSSHREAVERALHGLRAHCESLTQVLRREMHVAGAEIAELRAATAALTGYSPPAPDGNRTLRLDRVG